MPTFSKLAVASLLLIGTKYALAEPETCLFNGDQVEFDDTVVEADGNCVGADGFPIVGLGLDGKATAKNAVTETEFCLLGGKWISLVSGDSDHVWSTAAGSGSLDCVCEDNVEAAVIPHCEPCGFGGTYNVYCNDLGLHETSLLPQPPVTCPGHSTIPDADNTHTADEADDCDACVSSYVHMSNSQDELLFRNATDGTPQGTESDGGYARCGCDETEYYKGQEGSGQCVQCPNGLRSSVDDGGIETCNKCPAGRKAVSRQAVCKNPSVQ